MVLPWSPASSRPPAVHRTLPFPDLVSSRPHRPVLQLSTAPELLPCPKRLGKRSYAEPRFAQLIEYAEPRFAQLRLSSYIFECVLQEETQTKN